MADEVDSLTDIQLRTRLSEFGLPVVPITATTRKVMAKKLKSMIESGSKTAKANRLSLAKYSSGEESEEGGKKKSERSRRYTVGGAMLPPAKLPMKPSVRPKTPSEDVPQSTNNEKSSKIKENSLKETPITPARSSSIFIPTVEIKDDSSEDDNPVTRRRTTRIFKQTPGPPALAEAYDDSVSDSDEDVPLVVKPITPPIVKPVERKSFSRDSAISSRYVSTTTSSPAAELRDRSYGRTAPSLSTLRVSTKDSSNIEEFDSPFLSEFTRRLEQTKRMSVGSPSSQYDNHRSLHSSSQSYASRTELPPRSYDTYSSIRQRSSITPLTQKTTIIIDKLLKKKNLMRIFGVFLILSFIIFLGARYHEYTRENIFLIDADHNLPICVKAIEDSESRTYVLGELQKPGINCVLEQNVKPALMLCKYIQPEIHRRAVAHHCSDTSFNPFMSSKDIIDFVLKQTPTMSAEQILGDIDNLQLLILKNPNWGLSIIDKTFNSDITNLEELSTSDAYQNLAIKIDNPKIPLYCILSTKFYSILYTLVVCVVGFCIVYGIQFLIKYIINKREENDRKVYAMVERIIEILRKEASGNDAKCVAINHIRDRLISPQQRQAQSVIWEKAANFLEQNESRVRSEVQTVAGEDFRVWRWLAANEQSNN